MEETATNHVGIVLTKHNAILSMELVWMDVTLAFGHQNAKVHTQNLSVFLHRIYTYFFHIKSIYIAKKANQTAGGIWMSYILTANVFKQHHWFFSFDRFGYFKNQQCCFLGLTKQVWNSLKLHTITVFEFVNLSVESCFWIRKCKH